MSVIQGPISPQAFEVVRDRIAEILADELHNQSVLAGDDEIDANVFVERFIPFDKTDMPAVNVMLARGTIDGQSAIQSDGTYLFNIDAYTKAPSSDVQMGDSIAIVRLHKLIGLCRAILENPRYKTLGFQPPFIMNRRAVEISIADPDSKANDGMCSAMGRLVFSVKVPESCELIVPPLIAGYNTQVKLELTDKGHMYINT
jgi:hypothetical protein